MTARPAVFNIPAGTPFVDALAEGLLARHGADPLTLSSVTVLLPNRRAARALREAFLRISDGRALLLPRLRPIGDVDEEELALAGAEATGIPEALADLRRLVLLANEVRTRPEVAGFAQALALGRELARFVDEVRIDSVDLKKLKALAPDDYAEHWQATLRFLTVLTDRWPAVLAESGRIDAAERRNLLLQAQVRHWQAEPPADPVYIAGSTGSIPASAALIGVVARSPRGAVILPGFDMAMTAEDHAANANEPTHPQHGMLRLLQAIGCAPEDVRPWAVATPSASHRERQRLIREALRPGETAHAWAEAEPFGADAASGLRFVEAQSPQEEAAVIALLLRETLETAGRRAALVTPDRGLARRVAATLGRWGIDIDDSAGTPLQQTPPGAFLRLLAEVAAQDFEAVPLLAALKHPLAAGGEAPERFRARVRRFERRALRGKRPPPGLAGLRGATEDPDAAAFIDRIAGILAPLSPDPLPEGRLPAEHLRRLVQVAEALAASDLGPRLWAGDAGEALARFVQDATLALEDESDTLPIGHREWPAVLDALMQGVVVRPAYGLHPRLAIWGPIEARLQQADRLILGGLNEGTWPADPGADPWLSRPMRVALGLPPPERRIGLAAHDIQQALGAGDVILTRAMRVEGSKTVPSRWWLRLWTLLGETRPVDRDLPAWAAKLNEPATVRSERPPAPRPPVETRPRALSVTRIELLIRDPYAIYARYILRLQPLDPLQPDSDALERGNFIHRAVDRFIRAFPDALPGNAAAELIAIGNTLVAEMKIHPATLAFWWPRFKRIAHWFTGWETKHRASGALPLATEIKGTIEMPAPRGAFVLNGTADRIDRLASGNLSLIDYKTGLTPTKPMVEAGFSPQLPLEAAMLARGAFAGIDKAETDELLYIRLSGGRVAGLERPIDLDAMDAAVAAWDGLVRLIARYDKAETPYLSRPRPQFLNQPGDYDHLARLGEWSPYGDGR